VALVARRAAKLTEVAAACKAAAEAAGKNVETLEIPKDLASPNAGEEIVKEVVDKFGRLDVVVNSAASFWPAPLLETTTEGFLSMMVHTNDYELCVHFRLKNVNVTASFVLSKAAIPHLRKTGGNMVFILSDSAHQPCSGLTAYCTSKAAVHMMAKVMALEEAPNGVRINTVSPGVVMTDLVKDFVPHAKYNFKDIAFVQLMHL